MARIEGCFIHVVRLIHRFDAELALLPDANAGIFPQTGSTKIKIVLYLPNTRNTHQVLIVPKNLGNRSIIKIICLMTGDSLTFDTASPGWLDLALYTIWAMLKLDTPSDEEPVGRLKAITNP